jgi:hypothetical protein
MYVRGRGTTRHLKGKQVPITLYLPPRKYWLLKALSHHKGESMQALLRDAVDQVLTQAHRDSLRLG